MVKVKCADCGFLAVRHLETQELVGPGETQRKNGLPPQGRDGLANLDVTPICVVNEGDLGTELRGPGPAHSTEVMQTERDCAEFVEWKPIYTPKEHLEVGLLAEQREWQRLCEKEQREWQRQCEADVAARHKEAMRVAEVRHREAMRNQFVVALISALAGVIVGLGSALLPQLLPLSGPEVRPHEQIRTLPSDEDG